jgi:EAL domain-containing protein (putative c-di-GMP-specific phosphodiesterase class I)
MVARMKARRDLESSLRTAIVGNELELYYQPLVSLRSGNVVGCEALLRWHHPELGNISPANFIPVAEETGLIIPLGEWVVQTACTEAAKWPHDIKVAVNVSPLQFKSGNLLQIVVDALTASGLSATRLELEITEAVQLYDDAPTRATLEQLRKLGVRIALDDFGTGFSSLSYLQQFPFDKIKIDRCFVSDVATSAESRSIVQAIISIAATRLITTTAEGVETEQQKETLRLLGCTEMQGYLFSPARSGREIAALLAASEKTETAA